MKRLVFLITFCLSIQAHSQVEFGFYPFQSQLSVATNSMYPVWADFRLEANTFFGNMNQELHFMVNLKRKEKVNFYAGVGVNVNLFNLASDIAPVKGYELDFGARIRPIDKCRSLLVMMEIGPYINQQFDGGIFRASIGVGYAVGKR